MPDFGIRLITPLGHSGSTCLPTIRGFIDAGFKRNGSDSFELHVTLPSNMTAEVALPDLGSTSEQLTINGIPIKGRLAAGRVWLNDLGSGSHHIIRRSGR